MEKLLFEQMGGTYYQEGDYYLPNLLPPKSTSIGIWGQRRRRYLRNHRETFYTALLLSGKLEEHLAEINQQAETMFSQLVEQFSNREDITEQLKIQDQMVWVGHMNNICERAAEIINQEIIYM